MCICHIINSYFHHLNVFPAQRLSVLHLQSSGEGPLLHKGLSVEREDL